MPRTPSARRPSWPGFFLPCGPRSTWSPAWSPCRACSGARTFRRMCGPGLYWTYLEGEDKGPLRAVGRLLLIVGVAVGCAPWWAAALLGAVLVPQGVAGFRQAYAPATVPVRALAEVPVWGREALAVGAALVILAALQSVKGLLPLR